MKRKELLQKSSTVAAVVLAAALMEPGTVQAASANTSQVVEQSAETAQDTVEIQVEKAAEKEEITEHENAAEEEQPEEETEESAANMEQYETEDTAVSDMKESNKEAEKNTANMEDETVSQNEIQETGWITNSDGSINYRKEDGTFAWNEILDIDGRSYYFGYSNELVRGVQFRFDGHSMESAEDGSILKNQWGIQNSYFYYGEDGKPYEDCIAFIDGKYYGFQSYGEKYTSQLFYMRTQDEEGNYKEKYYYAKYDGTLYVNTWAKLYDDWYYFGADAAGYEGIQIVDGQEYYFQNGKKVINETIEENGKCYISDENGILHEAADNDWLEFEGEWYYVKNGHFLKNCIEKINGSYYGFSSDGKRYQNGMFQLYNQETYDWDQYYAEEDGTLLTNIWTGEGPEDRCYYGSDGKAYDGLREIDGIQYYFENKALQKNTVVSVGGKQYVAGDEGELTEAQNNTWTEVDGKFYYLQNGEFLKGCVAQIGDAYYGFNSKGWRYQSSDFELTDDKTGEWNYYYAQEDGSLVVNNWSERYNERYYYGEKGKGFQGLQKVDGTWYYFSTDARMYHDQKMTTEDGKYYIAGSNGAVTEAQNNAWTEADGRYYYVQDGSFLEDGVKKIGEKYYLFESDGKRCEEGIQWRDENGSVYYLVKEDGSLLTNSWYKSDENTYYFGEDGKTYEGLQNIEGKMYYFMDGILFKNGRVSTSDQHHYIMDSQGVVTEAQNNAWTEVEDCRYYVKDGELLEDCIAEIEGNYYGFDYNGKMYRDTEFPIWDTETQQSVYYRARKDGSLIVNDKYKNDMEEEYYYGEGGKAYEGLHELNGKQYFFQAGKICKNQGVVADGKGYVASANGDLIEANKNGWTKVDGKWYYLKNDEFLNYQVEKIGDNYYGFNSKGQMYEDQFFEMYVTAIHDVIYCRAQKGGALITARWYEDVAGDRYYFGEDGRGYEGLHIIDDKIYYFSRGRMYRNETIEIGDDRYIAREDGTLEKVNKNGWMEIEHNYFYMEDGEFVKNCVKKIGDAYYGFDGKGRRYTSTFFEMYDEKNEEYFKYVAQQDGTLFCGGWYDEDASWYYFGEDGKGYQGMHTIDGKQYYFREGELCRSCIVDDNGIYYVCRMNGTLQKIENNQWAEVEGKRYYVQEGKALQNCVAKIGDAYYGFDLGGQMYENIYFSFGQENENGEWEYHSYYATEDGTLFCNGWNEDSYYGSNGEAYVGLREIDGKWYYFSTEGKVLQDGIVSAEGKTYVADKNGVLKELVGNNTWIQNNGEWYYIKNQEVLLNRIERIGTQYSAFDEKGRLYRDTVFCMVQDEEKHIYYADKNGYLKNNCWIRQGNQLYYFGEDRTAYNGLHTINGKQYFFRGHVLVTDSAVQIDGKNYICMMNGTVAEVNKNGWSFVDDNWYYVKDGKILRDCVEQIGSSYYGFAQDGKMRNNENFYVVRNDKNVWCHAKKGGSLAVDCKISDGKGDYWYLDSEGSSREGVQSMNGKLYYFENGSIVRNYIIQIDGINYVSGKSGELVKCSGDNRWIGLDGLWYYIKNQKFVQDKVLKIGKIYYYFGYNGQMTTNAESYVYEDGDGYWVRSKESGALYTKEWYFDGHNWYYYDEEGRRAQSGLLKLGNTLYGISGNGSMMTSGSISGNGNNYAADSQGNLQLLNNNTWTQVGNDWYYVKDGEIVKDQVINLGSAYYGFNDVGIMYTDTIFSAQNEGKYVTYSAEKSGKVRVNTEQETSLTKYWFDEQGRGYEGMKTLYGMKFFFEDGRVRQNCAYQYDGINYVSGADGRVLVLPYNGWTEVDGFWYLVSNGVLQKSCVFDGEKWSYLFNEDGVMVTNGILQINRRGEGGTDYYAADEVGIMLKNAWRKCEDGSWMYFGEDGKAVNGRQILQGEKYYFSDYRVAVNEKGKWNDKNYITDSNGIMHVINKDGWMQVGNYWYYIENDNVISNTLYKIGNDTYAFNYDAHMYENEGFYIWDEKGENEYFYYALPGGRILKNGSYEIKGEQYYFDELGRGFEGYHTVNGKIWYFESGRMVTEGAFTDEKGKIYAVDAKGKYRALKNNQWNLIEGTYYYVRDSYLCYGRVDIGGTWYYFDEKGRMCANATVADSNMDAIYHASTSGALLCNQWYTDETGTYFFDEWGRGYEGMHCINGKQYKFEAGKLI